MHIPVTLLKQDAKENCTLACIRILLDFYGYKLTREELERSLQMTSEGWIYMVEVARFFHSIGLNVDCFSYNLYYTGPQDAPLAMDRLVKILETEKRVVIDQWYKLRLEATIKAIKEGVNYCIHKPTEDIIASHLKKGVPLMMSVSSCALMNKQGDPYEGHDIILSGIEGNMLYYIDMEKGEEVPITFKDLMFAMLSRKIITTSAYMLAVTKSTET